MTQVVCPGCGVTLPAPADGSPTGPTHAYMTSSPECWAAFGRLLAVQYSHPEQMAFHQVVVDAYAVQHPGIQTDSPDPRAVQSVVPLEADPRATRAAAFAWAGSAWSAWQEHHTTVREWIAASGLS